MREHTSPLPRREFLRRTAQVAAVAGLAGSAASAAVPKDKKLTLKDTIPARVFGKTGIKLPVLDVGHPALAE